MKRICMTVNGKQLTRMVTPRTNLADFLREDLLLTGTHIGCEQGICGACTVLVDGETARSCITYAVTCDGADVRTIEAFDEDPLMEKLRQAFSKGHALQCGYCTPGMLVTARDLIRRRQALDETSIRVAMSGNLCRCTGYMGIIQAIANVADDHRHEGDALVAERTLGPAPGPGAPDGFTADEGISIRSAAETAPATAPILSQQPGDHVQTSQVTQDGKFTTLTQAISVNHPPDQVWRFMADIENVAGCMPGVTLDGPPQNNHVTGRMLVKLGPISADLSGEADIELVESDWLGTINGKGRDSRSASIATGRVEYRLDEGDSPQTTRIAVSVAYSLAGPLAQFSRGALVRDLVGRLAGAFAENLDARISGRDTGGTEPVALDAGSLVLSMIWGRIKELCGRIIGRG